MKIFAKGASLSGRRCWGGLDLSAVNNEGGFVLLDDITANDLEDAFMRTHLFYEKAFGKGKNE